MLRAPLTLFRTTLHSRRSIDTYTATALHFLPSRLGPMSSLPAPLNALAIGDSLKVQSASSSSEYTIKNTGGEVYSCTCPSWRIQKKGVDLRSCKHLRAHLGDAFENARTRSTSSALATGSSNKRSYSTSASGGPPAKKGKKDTSDDKKNVEVLLAQKFDLGGKKDPKGYWISEKLDGIRAFWDGTALYSRLGNKFHAPAWFLRKLPKSHTLDGELFHSRGNFNQATSIVRSHESQRWNEIRYKVFDIPSMGDESFEHRLDELKKIFPDSEVQSGVKGIEQSRKASLPSTCLSNFDSHRRDFDFYLAAGKDEPEASSSKTTNGVVGSGYKWVKGPVVDLVEHIECSGMSHLVALLSEVEKAGGEGLMLREPKSKYVGKRSTTLLKVKTFFDAEARVIAYELGKGKYKGMTGSLVCEMESGKKFSVGSGLTDAMRSKPPKIGAIVTYRFQEVTKDLVPRFPTFVGERIDASGPKDADVGRKTAGTAKDDDGEAEEEDDL